MAPRPIRPHRAPETGEAGFTVIEVVVAIALFAIVAIGFAGTMSSSLAAQLHSRMRTTANQLATQQVEQARSLSYDDVGTTGGNPTGTLASDSEKVVGATTYRVHTEVDFVADAVEGVFATGADYKRLVVTVTRSGSTTVLARVRTLVAPPTQPNLSKAIVRAEVVDTTDETQRVAGVTVQLTGPSGPRSGVTNADGYVLFPALQPTGDGETYRIAATNVPAPWRLADEQVETEYSGEAAVTTTKTLRLRLTKPTPVVLHVADAVGAPVAAPTRVVLSSIRGTSSYTTSTGVLSVDLWSGVTYTAVASTIALPTDPAARFSPPVAITPATSGSTAATLQLNRSTRPLTVQVRQPDGTTPLSGIVVQITGNAGEVLLAETTDATGSLVVPVPADVGTYTVTADAQLGWLAKTTTVPAGGIGVLVLAASP